METKKTFEQLMDMISYCTEVQEDQSPQDGSLGGLVWGSCHHHGAGADRVVHESPGD